MLDLTTCKQISFLSFWGLCHVLYDLLHTRYLC
nr:MAG TPA: hypothetical protein [Caudoviricetes sp.]